MNQSPPPKFIFQHKGEFNTLDKGCLIYVDMSGGAAGAYPMPGHSLNL